jgi:hypothetical protein
MRMRGSFKALHPLTHTLMFLKKKELQVSRIFLRINPLLITILINQNQVLGRKNRNSYRPPKINKGESPKSCSYCKKKGTFFRMFLKETIRVHRNVLYHIRRGFILRKIRDTCSSFFFKNINVCVSG